MPSRVSGRASWGCRSLTSCSLTTPIARCRIIWTADNGVRARASLRSHRRWMSAIRVTWSACATSFPICPNLLRQSVRIRSMMPPYAGAFAQPLMTGARSAVRTRRWRRKFTPDSPRHAAAKAPGFLVATAHPAKFREIVEPLIGEEVPVPESLMRLLARPTACTEIPADLEGLRAALTA